MIDVGYVTPKVYKSAKEVMFTKLIIPRATLIGLFFKSSDIASHYDRASRDNESSLSIEVKYGLNLVIPRDN